MKERGSRGKVATRGTEEVCEVCLRLQFLCQAQEVRGQVRPRALRCIGPALL